MATIQQLEEGLRKAHAAGNQEHARRFAQAIRDMRGTGPLEPGNIDLNRRPRVKNPDGSISTVRSMSANFDGREVLIPTVSEDGRVMDDDEAIDTYRRTGRHLGMFRTPQEATTYAEKLHQDQERLYAQPAEADRIAQFDRAAKNAYAGTGTDQFGGGRPDFSGVTARVNSTERIQGIPSIPPADVGLSGVTREERQRQIRQADRALAEQARGVQRQEQLGRALSLTGRSMLSGLAAIPDIAVTPAVNLLNRALPEKYQQMDIGGAVNYLADKAGAARPETAGERVYSDFASGLTGVATGVGIGRQLAQSGGQVASRVGQLLQSRPGLQLAGAGTGAVAQGATREAGGSPTQQLAAGLVGAVTPAALAEGVPAAVSGALSRSVPEARKQVARQARDMGIDLSPAQLSDSRFLKWAQSMLRSIPFTGAQGRYQQQVGQFNRALTRTVGENAESLTPEVYAGAKARQSATYDDLTSRTAVKVDDGLIKRLSSIAEGAKINADAKRAVEDAIDALYSQATTGKGGVVIPGEAFQAFDSQLGGMIKAGGPLSYHLGMVQGAVRNALEKSVSPKDADMWRQLRREYGARKTLAPLVAKAEGGMIPPGQVMGAATNSAAAKEAMASGRRGDVGDLARIGQLIKEPPSSGTAERSLVGGVLGGAAYMDPITGGLTAASLNLLSRGIDSRSLARLMIQENPGLTMEAAERIIAQSLPAATAVQATQ